MYQQSGMYGLRGIPAAQPQPIPQGQALNGPALDCGLLGQVLQEREKWVKFLAEHGEMFWLPVSLGLGTTPASGTNFLSNTNSQDFNLLIVGADCTIQLSTIQITDSARNRALTNSTVPIGAIADLQTSTATTIFRTYWPRPYLLPARSQLNLVVTANGTESNGTLTFYCLQPPAGVAC